MLFCSMLSGPAYAARLIDLPEWQYANTLEEAAFTGGGIRASAVDTARGSGHQFR